MTHSGNAPRRDDLAETGATGRPGLQIARIVATPLNIPVELEVLGIKRATNLSACICEIETKDGTTGHGFTGITEEEVIASIINEIAAPALIGEDAMRHERLWDRLYWLMSPRGQTGYAAHAQAAIDIALWDIKGKTLNQPVWRLLGGARDTVPIYTTFGFSFLDRDALAASARYWVGQGHSRLKMTVGAEALQRRDEPRPQSAVIAEDARRVLAVREAIGPDAEIYIDANCSLDASHAVRLARDVAPARIGFFEEPISQNDVYQMANLRRQSGVAVAAGQNEGLSFRFRDMLLHGAADVLQPNVAITGGYTQCQKIAGMAAAFNTPIANGGAWPFHNMHLHAGLANGGLVEYHLPAVALCQQIYNDLPTPQDGWLKLPSTPGLGFSLNHDAVKSIAQRPTSRGRGKG